MSATAKSLTGLCTRRSGSLFTASATSAPGRTRTCDTRIGSPAELGTDSTYQARCASQTTMQTSSTPRFLHLRQHLQPIFGALTALTARTDP